MNLSFLNPILFFLATGVLAFATPESTLAAGCEDGDNIQRLNNELSTEIARFEVEAENIEGFGALSSDIRGLADRVESFDETLQAVTDCSRIQADFDFVRVHHSRLGMSVRRINSRENNRLISRAWDNVSYAYQLLKASIFR